jgi:hypothetical protein
LLEVAEVVGELVRARREQPLRKSASPTRGTSRRSHQRSASVPYRGGERPRVDARPAGLRDLLPVDGQVVVDEDRRRQWLPGREENRRPIDRVKAGDPLPDHMYALVRLPPPMVTAVTSASEVQRGDVVRERVEPD